MREGGVREGGYELAKGEVGEEEEGRVKREGGKGCRIVYAWTHQA